MILNEKMDLRKLNRWVTLVLWAVFCLASMSAMLYAAAHKPVLLVDNAGERISIAEVDENLIRAYSAQKLKFQEDTKMTASFRIPVEKNIKAENIVIDNRYPDRQLRIYIKGADYRFYDGNPVSGDLSGVLGGECLSQDGGIVLIIHMNEAYEYQTTLNDGELVVDRMKMSDAYEMVVVVDPAGGGKDSGSVFAGFSEKDITLNVALLLSEKITQPDIRVLVTRFADTDLSDGERAAFTEEVGADIYIRVSLNASEDISDYGITGIYNDEYFIPDFGNLELADVFIRNLAVSVSNRANGLLPAPEDSILKEFQVPAAQIQLGNLSNDKERGLLLRKDYQNLLADGLADAIMETYGALLESSQ